MLENGVNTHHALWTHYLSPMAWMMWMQEGLMKPWTEETLVKEQKKLTQEMFIKIFVHNLSSMHVFPNSSLKCKYGFSIRSFFFHKCVLVVFNRLKNRIWIIIEFNIKSMLIMLDWVANIWEKILEKKLCENMKSVEEGYHIGDLKPLLSTEHVQCWSRIKKTHIKNK